jgi:hypothetical protein
MRRGQLDPSGRPGVDQVGELVRWPVPHQYRLDGSIAGAAPLAADLCASASSVRPITGAARE